jgi:Na+-transporting NADH:ubiquinone oxidoreductase subunit F
MSTIVIGVFLFTVIILSLVAVLMVAKRQLVAGGEVSIIINDDPSTAIKVPSGGTLLASLAEKKIFIPSACGGKGSCGVCKVDVQEGGGIT